MGVGKEKEWSCKIFGEVAPGNLENGENYGFWSLIPRMRQFGHFPFTDFDETWQEYVNPCAGEWCRSEILNFCVKVSK